MRTLRGTLIGCGFFSRNHLHAWADVDGAEIVAVCDLDEDRARLRAGEFGVEGVYSDPERMLREVNPDFVDVVAPAAAHRSLVELAAREGVPVICQKPMAESLEDARAMVDACRDAGVPFMVHENFRWQTPMRAVKEAMRGIGEPFYGRIHWRTPYDVYADQPYLATDERFILADVGVHLFDLLRYFLGEVEELYCRTQRVNPRIRGEDVATVVARTRSGATCLVEMSYASRLPEDHFPQTFVDLEGPDGSVSLGPDFRLTVLTPKGVERRRAAPVELPWSSPRTAHIQESVLRIQQHWVESFRSALEPETSGRDNLKTLELVFAAYESAQTGSPVAIP